MLVMFSYGDGRRAEGIVLAISANEMRVAIPGDADAVELHRDGAVWLTDVGDRVELDTLLSGGNPGKAASAPYGI